MKKNKCKDDKSKDYELEDFMIITDENKKGYKLTKRGRRSLIKFALAFILLVVIIIVMIYLSKLRFDLHYHLNGLD